MARISHQVVPSGGWKYLEGSTKLQAVTFDLLVKLLLDHRRNNDLPIGNPVEDIEDQIAEAHPELIINGSQVKKKAYGR